MNGCMVFHFHRFLISFDISRYFTSMTYPFILNIMADPIFGYLMGCLI